jgi:hypothetical protein
LLEHLAQDVLAGQLLENPAVLPAREHPQPRMDHRAVAGETTVHFQMRELRDIPVEIPLLRTFNGIGLFQRDRHRLADHLLEFDVGVLRHKACTDFEIPRQLFGWSSASPDNPVIFV